MSESQEFLKRLNAALALRDIPDHPAALLQLQKAQDLDPEDASVHLLLGLTYQELDQLENAEKQLHQAHELDQTSLEITEAYGILLSRIKKNQEAIQLLKPLFDSNPKNLAVSRALASSLSREEKNKEAIEVLQITHSKCTNNVDIVLDLADLYGSQKQYELAERLLQEFLNIEESDKVLSRLGYIHLQQDKQVEAIPCFEKAITLREDYESAWIGLTRAHIESGNLELAINTVDIGISRKPKSKRLFQLKGEILFLQDKADEGLEVYNRAIALAMMDEKSLELDYFLFIRDRKILSFFGPNKALSYIEEDIKRTNGFSLLISLKSDLLLGQKKYTQAIKFIDSLDPEKYHNLLLPNYYQALIGIGEFDRAINFLQRNVSAPNFRDKDLFLNLLESEGVSLYSKDEFEKSKKIFEHVLILEPTRPRSLNNLAFIHISLHEWDEALNLLEQAQHYGFADAGILFANRGYVFVSNSHYKDGIEIIENALATQNFEKVNDDDKTALLHIAYPLDKAISFSQEDDFPDRSIPIKLALYANLATAYFLFENKDRAFEYANQIVVQYPTDNIGYRLLGYLYFNENQFEKASKFWRKALRVEKSKREGKRIKEMLELLSDREKNG